MREPKHLSREVKDSKSRRRNVNYLPRPTSVTVDHGSLIFRWRNASRYSPPAGLLSQFLTLKDEGQIRRFANTYGPLSRVREHIPERISDWQRWVEVASAIVRSGDDLTRGRVGRIEDWTGLHGWIEERPIRMTPGELSPEKDPVLWRGLIAGAVRRWFQVFGNVWLAVDWSGKFPRMKPVPPDSLGAHLGVEMVEWIGRPLANTRLCEHCGRRFRHRTNAIYCQSCRKTGVPALLRKRKQRAEARRQKELKLKV